MQTNDIDGIINKEPVTDFGFWKNVIARVPDDILIEPFQISKDRSVLVAC